MRAKENAHLLMIFIDDIVQKSHIEKELLSNLNGIKTVFDGGAGSGRFLILLAKQGCKITHFDISQPMLDKAYELAEKEGVLSNIAFVKGMLEDLSQFNDKSFDLALAFDVLEKSVKAVPEADRTQELAKVLQEGFKTNMLCRSKPPENDSRLEKLLAICLEARDVLNGIPQMSQRR